MKLLNILSIFIASIVCTNVWAKDHALVVGISQYVDATSLKYADADALEYFQLLTFLGGKDSSNVDLLLNLDATKNKILTSFEKIRDKSKAEKIDHFIFIYAGHGAGEKLSYLIPDANQNKKTNVFLAPSDVKIERKYFYKDALNGLYSNDSFITVDELVSELISINANKITVILDSCYSGNEFFSDKLNQSISNLSYPRKIEVALIASARSDQPAAEYEELRHGALSFAVFKYLKEIAKKRGASERLVSYERLYKNVLRLFDEVTIEDIPLSKFHQPIFTATPDYKKIIQAEFIRLQEIAGNDSSSQNEYSKLFIRSKYKNFKIYVNGDSVDIDSSGSIILASGKHMVEYFIPDTSYRYSEFINVRPNEIRTISFDSYGLLRFNYDLKNVNEKLNITPPKFYINGALMDYKLSKEFDLVAGTHAVRLEFNDKLFEKEVEIRPNSPLNLNYLIEITDEDSKNIKNVSF